MIYRSDDVQQILQRSLEQRQTDTYSWEQLLEMGAELDLSPEALKVAEQAWLTQRTTEQEQQRLKAKRRRAFNTHLIPFLAVNTFLITLNLVTTPLSFWAIYPLLGWGLGLALHGWSATPPEGSAAKYGCKNARAIASQLQGGTHG